jgi:hypothetical protein
MLYPLIAIENPPIGGLLATSRLPSQGRVYALMRLSMRFEWMDVVTFVAILVSVSYVIWATISLHGR